MRLSGTVAGGRFMHTFNPLGAPNTPQQNVKTANARGAHPLSSVTRSVHPWAELLQLQRAELLLNGRRRRHASARAFRSSRPDPPPPFPRWRIAAWLNRHRSQPPSHRPPRAQRSDPPRRSSSSTRSMPIGPVGFSCAALCRLGFQG